MKAPERVAAEVTAMVVEGLKEGEEDRAGDVSRGGAVSCGGDPWCAGRGVAYWCW